MSTRPILIVEDEVKLAEILEKYLVASGYECAIVSDGACVMQTFEQLKPSIVLLDLMLPNVDGITLCKQIREMSHVPIAMMTAKVEEVDRLIGLEVGADDYICKPYSPKEVVARVKAILRRVNTNYQEELTESENTLSLDEEGYTVKFQQSCVSLTHVEFLLFKAMYSNPSRIFSRDKLMDHIYSDDRIVSDRTVDSHIKKLRKKLHSIAPELEFIHSIYGAGYKFELPYLA